MQTNKGQRELARHCQEIRCFNQVSDGLISSRLALGGRGVGTAEACQQWHLRLVFKDATVSFMSGERADILSHPNFRCGGWRRPKHQSLGLCWHWNNSRTKCAPVQKRTLVHAFTRTSCDKHLVWMWDSRMSASRAYISGSLSPAPSADNYSYPFSRTQTHQSCLSAQLKPEELSSGPSQNGARQGQALCSISLLIPVHLSFPPAPYPLLPPGPPTLSLSNFTPGLTSISRTTSALTLIHFQSCRVVGWMEIDDSIFGMKLKSPFGIDSPLLPTPLLLALLSQSWSAGYRTISLSVWRGGRDGYSKVHLKNAAGVSKTPFLRARSLSSLNCRQTSKHLKSRGFIPSIAPSWMLGGNLKMIYANVISLCVIQRSRLMSELLQPNYKLTRRDIIARLMCFSGTCLIGRRLRWG